MSKTLFILLVFITSVALAADTLVDRWAAALGGREKIAAIKSLYREATIQAGPYQGTIKIWHTGDGKTRREEQIATRSTIETFDGVAGMIQQGKMAPRKMDDAELEMARSKRFSNWNAILFVLFPDRFHGVVKVETENALSFKPDGGIEWRVDLDPKTFLPKTMTHKEGGGVITVTFDSYETIEGIQFEKEMHRSGNGIEATIRFTKTVINPPIDSSLFSSIQ